MIKPNCNKLSIGQPGTGHINWQPAHEFIANRFQQIADGYWRTSAHPLLNFVSKKTNKQKV